MKFAVFLMLLLCLSYVSAAPYDPAPDSIEANYLHSAARPMIRIDNYHNEEDRRRARKQQYLEQMEILSERADPPGHAIDEHVRAESNDAGGDESNTESSSPAGGGPATGSDDSAGGADDGANQIPKGSPKKKAPEEQSPKGVAAGSPDSAGSDSGTTGDDDQTGGESANAGGQNAGSDGGSEGGSDGGSEGGSQGGSDGGSSGGSDGAAVGGAGDGSDGGPGVADNAGANEPGAGETPDSKESAPASAPGAAEGGGTGTEIGGPSEAAAAEAPSGASEGDSAGDGAPNTRPGDDESSGAPDATGTRPQGLRSYLRRAPERIAALRNALRMPSAPWRGSAGGEGNEGPSRQRPRGARQPGDPEGGAASDDSQGGPGKRPGDPDGRPDPQRGQGALEGGTDASGDSSLKWTDPKASGQGGTRPCASGENCDDGVDQSVVDAMPVGPPMESVGCRSLDKCVFITQHRKIFGPYELTGLTQHFQNTARLVDMLIGGQKIRGFLMGPLRTLGLPFQKLLSIGSRKK